ncbi:MAG: DegV family protein [Oscillospiraceae bacterium]|nr:DegV family protein [Oscillospiraceae bacterium]
MSDYVLMSDSTTDLPPGMADELGVEIVPLSYIIDGEDYDDVWGKVSEDGRVSPSAKEFYDLMRSGKTPTTSQINESRFIEFFSPHLKAEKDIIFLAFSSGLSGTFEQAVSAAGRLLTEFNKRKITVIDSLTASMGEGLYLYKAALKKKAGALYEELVEYMKEIRMKIHGRVTLDDLQFLKRGGRLNAPAAFVGNVLNLKPIITVDEMGRLIVLKKVRGRENALSVLIDEAAEIADDTKNDPIFISHSDCPDTAEKIKEMLKSRFGTKTIITSYIGPVIGSHAGPGTIAIFFSGRERSAAHP